MDDLTGGASLAVPPKHALPLERMPRVVNHDFLPDMGCRHRTGTDSR
jgi:hypothetical protein